MGEILSEQELDALLSERLATGKGSGRAGAVNAAPFSFIAPVPFTADALDRLSGTGSQFANGLRQRLAEEIRREIAISVAGVEIVGGLDGDRIFSGGAHLQFEGPGGRRAADLVFDTATALALVEARLGGSVAEPQPQRALTLVEMRLLARLMGVCGGSALAASFGCGMPEPGSTGRSEAAPGDDAPATDTIGCRPGSGAGGGTGYAALTMQVSIEQRGGAVTLLVPASRAAELSAPPVPAPRMAAKGRRIPTDTIRKLPVRVVPRIPGGSISLDDLMAIRPGVVVHLDQSESEPIEILCNGKSVLRGRLIRSGSVPAIEVSGWAQETETKAVLEEAR